MTRPAGSGSVGRPLLDFVAESTRGEIDTRRIRGQRPLVLVFVPSVEAPGCRAYLAGLAADESEYRRLQAAVVVITAAPAQAVTGFPFAIISGAADLFGQFCFQSEEILWAGVVIADRYGMVAHRFAAPRCDQLPAAPRVARLLQGAESVCPECGVPEERWLDVVT